MDKQQLPEALLRSLAHAADFDRDAFVQAHISDPPPVSVRFNPAKEISALQPLFPGMEPVPWSDHGYYLPSRPSFILDPLWHAGAYYVQEPSSMFLGECLKQCADLSAPLRILDLCAAPGGKSTLLSALISPSALLVSNEVIKTRVNTLVENLSRWGALNTVVTSNDARDFGRLPAYFDVMIVDAPCSGSGLFRRDPHAIEEWSPALVELCCGRQRRILSDALATLKDDGVLVYSTCSYSTEENEDIADWLCSAYGMQSLPLRTPAAWNITESRSRLHEAYGYRFYPDRLRGEGFYIACFRKAAKSEDKFRRPASKPHRQVAAREETIVRRWLNGDTAVALLYSGEDIFAFPEIHRHSLADIHGNLYTKKAGVMLGRLAKDQLVPAHELALSRLLHGDCVSISLNPEQALQYLRKEDVKLEAFAEGWATVSYGELHLGWVKLLKHRVNNYYPKEWRILKSGKN